MSRTPLLRQLTAPARVADRSHRRGLPTGALLDGEPAIGHRAFRGAAGAPARQVLAAVGPIPGA